MIFKTPDSVIVAFNFASKNLALDGSSEIKHRTALCNICHQLVVNFPNPHGERTEDEAGAHAAPRQREERGAVSDPIDRMERIATHLKRARYRFSTEVILQASMPIISHHWRGKERR
jgi:hypothetical protein